MLICHCRCLCAKRTARSILRYFLSFWSWPCMCSELQALSPFTAQPPALQQSQNKLDCGHALRLLFTLHSLSALPLWNDPPWQDNSHNVHPTEHHDLRCAVRQRPFTAHCTSRICRKSRKFGKLRGKELRQEISGNSRKITECRGSSQKVAEIRGMLRKFAERGRTTTCSSGCAWQSAQTHPAPAQVVLIFVDSCVVLRFSKLASTPVVRLPQRVVRDLETTC